MRIENWDAERKRDSAQHQELRIGQMNSSKVFCAFCGYCPRFLILLLLLLLIRIPNDEIGPPAGSYCSLPSIDDLGSLRP